MSQNALDKLLRWLDSDGDVATQKYLKIQQRLSMYFVSNGGGDGSDDLASETIDRLMQKLDEGKVPDPYVGDKVHYFYGFAKNVLHEYRRRKPLPPDPTPWPNPLPEAEDLDACLEACRKMLSSDDQWLALEYYRFEADKSGHHIRLAEQMGLSLAGLRTRIYRIRKALEPCIEECLKRR